MAAQHHCCTRDLSARLARPRLRQHAVTAAAAATPVLLAQQRRCLQLHSSSSSSSSRRRAGVRCCSGLRLVLYTKPHCPLCDGLQDKLSALIDRAAFAPSFLSGASLEVRDISTNAAWQDAMHLAVPVLAVLRDGNQAAGEAVLARPPPRVPADRLQRHLREALEAAGVDCSGGGSGDAGGGDAGGFTVVR